MDNRTDYYRQLRADSMKNREDNRYEDIDPEPLVVPVRLPTIEQQIHEFTRLGQKGWEERHAYLYDDLQDDDFQDHLDDLPEQGISPHEELGDEYLVPQVPEAGSSSKKSEKKEKLHKKVVEGDSNDSEQTELPLDESKKS